MQGGSSHMRHGRGRKRVRSSDSSRRTCIQLMVRPRTASLAPTAGTLFSALQAMVHAWQPVQRSRSITIPQSAMSGSVDLDPRRVEETEASEGVRLVRDQVVLIGALPAEERDVDDVGQSTGEEPGPESDPALRGLHPDPVTVLDPDLRGRVRVHLAPALPGCADVDGGLLEEPWLVPPAADRPGDQAVRVETERKRSALAPRRKRGHRQIEEVAAVAPTRRSREGRARARLLLRLLDPLPERGRVELELPGRRSEERPPADRETFGIPPGPARSERLPELVVGLEFRRPVALALEDLPQRFLGGRGDHVPPPRVEEAAGAGVEDVLEARPGQALRDAAAE